MLGFYRAADNSKAVYNLQDQVIDEFVSSGGVDSANSSDQTLRDGHYSGFGVGSASDTYTKLLINGNSLEDSSDSRHAVTANGNPTINGSTYKFGSGSMHFDGTGDYLQVSTMDSLSSGIWTIDCWWMTTDITTQAQTVLSGDDMYWGILFNYDGSGKMLIDLGNGSSWSIANEVYGTKTSWANDTWYHIALIFDGNAYKLYIDGSLDLTITTSTSIGSSSEFNIGVWGNNNWGFHKGYIDEIRVSKGIARWTSSFTPPTSAYSSYDSYTKLMLHFPGDKSTSSHNVTFNGITSFMPKFDHSSAMYFDGSGDYLEVADSDDWDWESDFTVDYWFKPLSWDSNTDGFTTFSQASSATKGFWTRHRAIPKVTWDAQDGGSTLDLDVNIDADDGPKVGEWAHWAWIRSGDDWYVYINGTRANQAYPAGTTDNNPGSAITAPLRIGKSPYRFDDALHGYIDEFRVSNTVRWATTFTPPTSEYDNPDSNTKLLIRSDTTDGSTTFTDSSPEGHTVTRGGGTKHFAPKFGRSAMYFSGSYLEPQSTTLLDITSNSQSFTYDLWVYPTSIATSGPDPYRFTSLISKDLVYLSFGFESDGTIKFYTYDGSEHYCETSAGIMQTNQWQHIAYVSNAGTLAIYYNGVSKTLNSTTLVRPTQTPGTGVGIEPKIGHADTGQAADAFIGYMDEIRISDGIARTDAGQDLALTNGSFTPPTEAYSDVTIEDMTLQSVATTAEAAPTSGDIVMLIENAAGTAVLNTDIKAYVSRNGGTTFTEGTLTDEGSWGTNKKILAFHDLDISGQSSGTSMKYKITTHNQAANKETRIHAVSLAWS
jgi:hypothetical protein